MIDFKQFIDKVYSLISPLFTHPKKHLKTWLVILGVLAASWAVVFFLREPEPTQASWWDETWLYRKAIQISNDNGEDLTDFQVAITLDTASLITAGKMQSDCDDLRITDINGNVLPHWVEENNPGCNNAATKIWVKVPTVYNGTNATTVYVYYGNTQANNVENGDNVFEFFDDFNDGSLDTNKWEAKNTGTGSHSISGGQLTITSSGDWWNTSDTSRYIVTKSAFGTNYVSEAKIDDFQQSSYPRFFGLRASTATNSRMFVLLGDNDASHITNAYRDSDGGSAGWYGLDTGSSNPGTGKVGKFEKVGDTVTSYYNGTQTNSRTTVNWNLEHLALTDTENYGSKFDWIFVRQYASTEPSTGTPGSEEQSPGPVAYWKFDEGTGTTTHDSSGQGNDGTINGATWQNEDMCISGKCLYFDSTANHYVRSDNNLLLSGNQTFSVWVYPTTTSSGLRGIFTTHNHSTTSNIGINQYNNRYTISIGYTDSTREYSSKQSNHIITANQWDYVVLVYDLSANSVSLYINGTFDKQWTLSKEVKFTSEKILVGQWSNAYLNYYKFNGKIDEPKIYPYARTEEQIKSDYATGLAGISSTEGSSSVLGSSGLGSALNDGLVAYYKMDESSWNGTADEVIDSSGNGNHGVGVGATPPTTGAGKFGNGGVFDGSDDYVDIGSSEILGTSTENFTISGWIKISDVSDNGMLYTESSSSDNDPIIQLGYNNSNLVVVRRGNNGTGLADTNAGDLTGLSNQWIYLTLVNNETEYYTYINGSQADTGTYEQPDSGTFDRITIGARRRISTDGYTNGSIDEVRIYNRALSSEEVKALYEWAPGPVAHYTFDEGSGNTVTDISGYGNNGTWYGSTTQRYTAGKYGSAGSFNGSNDYVDITDSSSLRIDDNFTIGMWVKPVSGASGHFISKRGPGNIFVGIRNSDIYIRDANGQTANPSFSLDSNQWQYLTAIKKGTTVNIYKNGVKVGFVTNESLGSVESTGNLQIGGETSANKIETLIDDVRIYNYARTQKQILEDMEGSRPGAARMPQPIAHWKFDEGYGSTTHDTISGNHGTMGTGSSAPSWTNEGKIGKALSFDGDYSYINLNNNVCGEGGALGFGTGDYSYTFWFKSSSSIRGEEFIIHSWNGGGTTGHFVRLNNGAINAYLGDGTNSKSISTDSAYDDNQWHHTSITANRDNNMKIYVDGHLVKETDISSVTGNLNQTNYCEIGTRANLTNKCYEGSLDEVKIYNYALSEEEVKQDYNQGMAAVMGQSSGDTGSTAPAGSAAQEYCVPGSSDYCAPPVAEWNFEEGSGNIAYDKSGNGNDGTWYGTGNHWGTGKIGKAGVFNGSDTRVSVGNDETLQINGGMTIGAWIKPNEDAITGWVRPIFDKMYIAASKTSGYALYISSGNIYLAYGNGTTGESLSTSGLSWDTSRWYHIMATHDGNNTVKIYRNGLLVAEKNDAVGPVLDNGDYEGIIGRRIGSSYTYFDGLIDQVRIYDYARTPAQIAWDYNRGAPVAHWKFDECQGTVAHDSSGNENHGTINIGASAPQTTAGTCTDGSSASAWYNGKSGKWNSSLSFDGVDDYVISQNANISEQNNGVTSNAWAFISSPISSQTILISHGGGNWSPYSHWKLGFHSSSRVYLYTGWWTGIGGDGGISAYSSNNAIPLNEWFMITGVLNYDLDSNTTFLKAYINGEVVINEQHVGKYLYNITSRPFVVGALTQSIYPANPPEHYFPGLIDDVRIYNYALTDEQIKTLYNNGAVRFGE